MPMGSAVSRILEGMSGVEKVTYVKIEEDSILVEYGRGVLTEDDLCDAINEEAMPTVFWLLLKTETSVLTRGFWAEDLLLSVLAYDATNSVGAHLGHKAADARSARLAQQNAVEELEEILWGNTVFLGNVISACLHCFCRCLPAYKVQE